MKTSKLFVKIAGSASQLSPTENDETYLVLSPSTNGWNDFGYRLIIDVHLALTDTLVRLGTGRLIVADHKATSSFIIEQKITAPKDIDSVLMEKPFLFAFTEPESYRKLKTRLNTESAKELLLKVHDWGAIMNFEKNSVSLEKLKSSEGLIKGLLREDKIFNAGRNLKSILHEDSFFSNSEGVAIRCEVPMPYGESLSLSLEYIPTPFGLTRINILIGENGVGKTEILRFLHSQKTETNNQVFVSEFTAQRSSTEQTKDSPIRLTKITNDTQTNLTVFSDIILMASVLDERYDDEKGDQDNNLTSLILQTLRNPDSEWEALNRAMRSYIDMDDLYLPITSPANPKLSYIETSDGPYANISDNRWGEERSLEFFDSLDQKKDPAFFKGDGTKIRLSSGQRSFFRYSLILMQSAPKYSLFLIDEPELTLHPQMIAALMRITDAILQSKQSFAVIATHSLHVIGEVHKEAVHVITRDRHGKPVDMTPFMQTFGSDLSELSSVVFPEDDIEELFEQKVAQTAGELLRKTASTPDDQNVNKSTPTAAQDILDAEEKKLIVRQQLAGFLGPVGSNFLRDTLETLEKENAKN